MRELEVRKADLPLGELAMQPVPVVMFTTTHPARRTLHVRDVQGLLKHVELFGFWFPVTQAIISCMDKVVVVSVRVINAVRTPFGIAIAPSLAVIWQVGHRQRIAKAITAPV